MQKLDQYAFVLWKDYDAVRLCKPPEEGNIENPHVTAAVGESYATYPIAVVGEVYGRGWGEGKVILTRPIAKIEGSKIKTDTGEEYLLEQKHPDYLAYEKARDEGIKIVQQYSFGAIDSDEESYIYISGNSGGYVGKQPNLRKAVETQEGALLTLHGGTKVFVDVFAMSWTQEYYIYEANETREKVVNAKATGRAFCGYKGAWLLDLYANDLHQCGVGGAPFLTAKRAKELGII